MSKNKSNSNKISIVIAIVAVILILGGVYLLNESFNSSEKNVPKSTDSKAADSITYSVIDDSSDGVDGTNSVELFSENSEKGDLSKSNLETKSTESDKADEPSKTAENKKVVETDNKDQADVTNKSEEKKEEPKTTEAPKEVRTETVVLEDNQVLGKVLSTDGSNYRLEIVQCGIPNARICVPGQKLQLRALQEYTDITINDQYVLTGDIYEADGFIYVDTLDTVEPV